MPTSETPSQRRLANALRSLKDLQDSAVVAFKSDELSRTDKESLLDAGFLKPVIKGWYIASRPDEEAGDTTAWYANANGFIARYSESRFGDQWCLGADHSIRIQVGNPFLPPQVVLNSPHGQNTMIQLPGNHSIFDYKAKEFPSPSDLLMVNGLRVMGLEFALTRVQESFFRTFSQDAQIALMGLRDGSELSRRLIESGQSVVAGRLCGALRACGKSDVADEILASMRGVGHVVKETNPFSVPLPDLGSVRNESPYVTRIRLMWSTMRAAVIESFPQAPGLPDDPEAYMASVKESYVRDAYNSLSIEGYKVTNELIERVASGTWSPETDGADKQSKDAMAARGYFQSRKAVEESIRKILAGDNSGSVVSKDHRTWYRELFAPSVDAKILKPSDLAGYRGHQVFITNAAHVPPPVEAVRDMMPAFFDLLKSEKEPSVRAVLGHFIFVFTHPYMDGNGRMGRFIMNSMLASGGYPWTVVEDSRRSEYMQALNEASSKGNIRPFADFIASSVDNELQKKPAARKQCP